MLFNEIYYRNEKRLLNFNTGKVVLRNAVRAIITNENKLLMIHLGKTNEYKFPGGGMEENETCEEALKREVMEEAGYRVTEITEKAGIATEFAVARESKYNIFKMISEYYIAKIDHSRSEQKLDGYEKELLFSPCWVEIEKAYKANKEIIESGNVSTPWIHRETSVLGILMNKLANMNGRDHG